MYTECGIIGGNSTPEKVIERVRTILRELGVLSMGNWGQGTEKRYSLSLHLDGTGIFSKGKGADSGEKLELNRQFLQELSEMRTVRRSLMHLAEANNVELERAIEYMNNSGFGPDISVEGFIHKHPGQVFPWMRIKSDVFISSVYYKMGRFYEAYDTMSRYMHSPARRYDMFLNCMKDYYGVLTKEINNEPEIRSYLVKFYPENIIDRVISELKSPDEVFKNYVSIDCFNCRSCPYIRNCSYPAVEKLYRRLKERYAANPIDPESVALYMELPDKRPV